MIALPKEYGKYEVSYFILQKDSPFKELLNHFLTKFLEANLDQRFLNIYYPKFKGDVCPSLEGKPLGFNSCISAFLFLGIGIIITYLVLIGELILKRLSTKTSSRGLNSSQSTNEPIDQPLQQDSIEVASIEVVQLES